MFTNDSIDKFLKQVNIAKDYNSKELRMSIIDAEQLAISIAMLLNQNQSIIQKVMELQDKLLSQKDQTNIELNGGSF